MRFGQRLRALRLKRGLSQVEMAHRFGIDRGHISEMETGKKNVCLPMLDVLAEGFGITISELTKGV
jgi:transcriptional regulator with XRE-family HTH domain